MDAIIKIGGSLEKYPQHLKRLLKSLSYLAQFHNIIIVPGGGSFADCVRSAGKTFHLSSQTSHVLAILAMDQYGLVLQELGSNIKSSSNWTKVRNWSLAGTLSIYLPSKNILEKKTLPASWAITSDSISAYIAGENNISNLIFAKDVDGIFTEPPKTNTSAKLLSRVMVKELKSFRDVVDRGLHTYLHRYGLKCWIVNGLKTNRTAKLLQENKTVGTEIIQ